MGMGSGGKWLVLERGEGGNGWCGKGGEEGMVRGMDGVGNEGRREWLGWEGGREWFVW